MEWTHIPLLQKNELTTFTNQRRIIYKEGHLQHLLEIAYDTILVFDDFKALFIKKQAEINALRSLIIRRRQRKLDIFIVAHGFTEIIPSYLLTFANQFILFRTLDNPARVKDRFLDFQKISEAQKRVNEFSKQKTHYFEIINQ